MDEITEIADRLEHVIRQTRRGREQFCHESQCASVLGQRRTLRVVIDSRCLHPLCSPLPAALLHRTSTSAADARGLPHRIPIRRTETIVLVGNSPIRGTRPRP